MITSELLIQDVSGGNQGTVLGALSRIASMARHSQFYAAVAYANLRGVNTLFSAFGRSCEGWGGLPKRWLVTCDFGLTQPAALRHLLRAANSQVRVPSGDFLLAHGLRPRECFHPKLYVFQCDREGSLALVVGSANLTAGGLGIGVEAVAQMEAAPSRDRRGKRAFRRLRQSLEWFERAWADATVVDEAFISAYSSVRPRYVHDEDRSSLVRRTAQAAKTLGLSEGDLARWTAAEVFWIETRRLYSNRGPARAGSQLDMPRGTRVFFGFASSSVERNTIFGSVQLRYGTNPPVARTIKYANNQMDKINLPIPDNGGPASYADATLVFRRKGRTSFDLRLATPTEARRLFRASARQGLGYEMTGGRRYGFL